MGEPEVLRHRPGVAARLLPAVAGAVLVAVGGFFLGITWLGWAGFSGVTDSAQPGLGRGLGVIAVVFTVVPGLVVLAGLSMILGSVVGTELVWSVDHDGIAVARRTTTGRTRRHVVDAQRAAQAYVMRSTSGGGTGPDGTPHASSTSWSVVVQDVAGKRLQFPCGSQARAEEALSRIRAALTASPARG